MIEKNYTLREAADIMRCCVRTIGNLRRDGKLGYIKAGGKAVIPESAIKEFLDKNKVEAWQGQNAIQSSDTSRNMAMVTGTLTRNAFQLGQKKNA